MSAVSAEFSHASANAAAPSGRTSGTSGEPSGGEPDAEDRRPDRSGSGRTRADFGPNEWLVDELYQRYQADPASVDRAWWNFFADYRPEPTGARRAASRERAATGTAAQT
ncbi:MAG: 2-oxoglutarate dehydrogenase E1 subunit family protein, partial [Streptosporangiaceae bacterium]